MAFDAEKASQLVNKLFDQRGNPRGAISERLGWVCVPLADADFYSGSSPNEWFGVLGGRRSSFHILNIFGWLREWSSRGRAPSIRWINASADARIEFYEPWYLTDSSLSFVMSECEDGATYLCGEVRRLEILLGKRLSEVANDAIQDASERSQGATHAFFSARAVDPSSRRKDQPRNS